MTESIAGVVIPDSALAREATELVREAADDLLAGGFDAWTRDAAAVHA